MYIQIKRKTGKSLKIIMYKILKQIIYKLSVKQVKGLKWLCTKIILYFTKHKYNYKKT